jgi:hypothetical protein
VRVVCLALLLTALVVLGACASEEVTEPDAAPVTVTETVEAGATDGATTEEATTEETTTEEAPPEPEFTVAQEEAIESALSYLDYAGFSKKGLIEQLKYEGFTPSQAKFAVNAIKVNWRQEAVESAQSYLDYSGFSRQGLIDQLEYEGFTPAQAAYAANKVGL